MIIDGAVFIKKERGFKDRNMHSVVYANSVEYEFKEDMTLTARDIEAIKKYAELKGSNVIEVYNNVKEGLLLSAVFAYRLSLWLPHGNVLYCKLIYTPAHH